MKLTNSLNQPTEAFRWLSKSIKERGRLLLSISCSFAGRDKTCPAFFACCAGGEESGEENQGCLHKLIDTVIVDGDIVDSTITLKAPDGGCTEGKACLAG